MKVAAVSLSKKKGIKKNNVSSAMLIADHGLEGDAHADGTHRQLSLLDMESIKKMQKLGALVKPGDFAENITTEGICLYQLPIGTKLSIGSSVLLELTQIGKECHSGCAIAQEVGTCVMPREGVFCRILKGGEIKPGDEIGILEENGKSNPDAIRP